MRTLTALYPGHGDMVLPVTPLQREALDLVGMVPRRGRDGVFIQVVRLPEEEKASTFESFPGIVLSWIRNAQAFRMAGKIQEARTLEMVLDYSYANCSAEFRAEMDSWEVAHNG